jgi:hypothetical protein
LRPVEKMECMVVTFSKTGLIQITLGHFSPPASATKFSENDIKIKTSWPKIRPVDTLRAISKELQSLSYNDVINRIATFMACQSLLCIN